MSITRRLFLRNTAAAGAVAATVTAPVAAAEPEMTIRERAIWHMREIERLVREDGGETVVVQAIGTYTSNDDCRMIAIRPSGRLCCDDNMFARKGGEA